MISPATSVAPDGVARVVDFGIAKAASRAHTTQEGMVKGKLAYMSPEQVLSMPVDQRSDVFAVTVSLGALFLTERRYSRRMIPLAMIAKILAVSLRYRAITSRVSIPRSTPWSRGAWRKRASTGFPPLARWRRALRCRAGTEVETGR